MSNLSHLVPATVKLSLFGLLATTAYLQPYRPMVVIGRSMEPTYGRDSVVLTAPARPDQLKRGAVVVIDMDSGPIVKRIAFVAGDRIDQALMDGTWVDMVFVRAPNSKAMAKLHWREFVVPKNMVYLLGDNQSVSYDSKQFGCVSTARIHRIVADQRPFDLFPVLNKSASRVL